MDQQSKIKKLKKFKRLTGWTQEQVAKEFSVSKGSVGNWETGHRNIPDLVIKLMEMIEEKRKISDKYTSFDRLKVLIDKTTESSHEQLEAIIKTFIKKS